MNDLTSVAKHHQRNFSDPNKLMSFRSKALCTFQKNFKPPATAEISEEDIVEIEDFDKKTVTLPTLKDFNTQFLISNTIRYQELYPEGTSNYILHCGNERLLPKVNGITSINNTKSINVKYFFLQLLLYGRQIC